MTSYTCLSCEKIYDKDQRDRIIRNISQSIDEALTENLSLDCIQANLNKECTSSYIRIKELQKAHEQAKLQYQQAYQAWKDSIAHYEQHDRSMALIKHLIAQENKPKPVRKSIKKQLSEQDIVEAMLGALTEEQRAALSNIIQSGAIK